MNCPMCHIGPEFQRADPEDPHKSQCTGCGTKFFNPGR